MWNRGGHPGAVMPVQRPVGGIDDEAFARELAGYELADGLRKGTDGWVENLLARMPELPSEADGETAQYVEVVTRALADGKIVGREAREMALLAGQIGLSAGQAHQLHLDVLDGMAAVALEDGVLTVAEYDLLQKAAAQMSAAGRFDDLADRVDTTIQGTRARSTRRCGHCREVGHNRQTCTELVDA